MSPYTLWGQYDIFKLFRRLLYRRLFRELLSILSTNYICPIILPAFRWRKLLSPCTLPSTGTSLFPLWPNFPLRLLLLRFTRTGGRAVPAGVEVEPPPVVEAEVFSLLLFSVRRVFSFSLTTCFGSLSIYVTFGLFRLLVFFASVHFCLSVLVERGGSTL